MSSTDLIFFVRHLNYVKEKEKDRALGCLRVCMYVCVAI